MNTTLLLYGIVKSSYSYISYNTYYMINATGHDLFPSENIRNITINFNKIVLPYEFSSNEICH